MRKLRGFPILTLLLALLSRTASADPFTPPRLPEPPKPPEPIVIDTVQAAAGEMLCVIFQGASTGYCGGDPVNRADPMGTDYLFLTGTTGDANSSGDVYWMITPTHGNAGNVIRRVKIGTWDAETHVLHIDEKFKGGFIRGNDGLKALEDAVLTSKNSLIRSSNDEISDKILGERLQDVASDRHDIGIVQQQAIARNEPYQVKLMDSSPVLGPLRRGKGFWNGVKLFAYSFENAATMDAFHGETMKWSAYGNGDLTFSQAVDGMSTNFLKGGAGVIMNLAPYSSGFLKGSFRLAPSAARGAGAAFEGGMGSSALGATAVKPQPYPIEKLSRSIP